MLFALLLACDASTPSSPEASDPVFLDARMAPNFRVARYEDAVIDEVMFAIPRSGYVYEFDVHPQDGRLAISYTLPPDGDAQRADRSAIYVVHDGALGWVVGGEAAGSWSFYPEWSPEGDRLWYVSQQQQPSSSSPPELSWVDLQTGEHRAVQPWATEPAVSADAVAWIKVDPQTGQRSLELGDAEGAWQRTLVSAGVFAEVSQPVFSADGASVYFAAISEDASASSWEWPSLSLMSAAHARGDQEQPGDWWSVPVSGGAPERLSFLEQVQHDGAVDPVSGALLVATGQGMAQIEPQTGAVRWLKKARTLRAVGWAP